MARAYTLVSVANNGKETVVTSSSIVGGTDDELLAARELLIVQGRTLRATRRHIVYGPTDTDSPRAQGDRIWDSAVDQ